MNFASALVSVGLLSACAVQAQPDSRFDGIWVGTEIVTQPFRPKPKVIESRPAQIVIAQGGTLLAVANGHCPGRYADVHRSNNTLLLQARDCKLEVTLSGDGKTLTEKGSSMGVIHRTVPTGPTLERHRDFVTVEIAGTFHRQ